MAEDDLHRLGLKLKFVYSLVGLLVGLGCILVGMILGLAGVAGHTSWAASLMGLSTNINDAAPGVIVFVVGIFFVLITRFKVRDITTGWGGGGSEFVRRSILYPPKAAMALINIRKS